MNGYLFVRHVDTIFVDHIVNNGTRCTNDDTKITTRQLTHSSLRRAKQLEWMNALHTPQNTLLCLKAVSQTFDALCPMLEQQSRVVPVPERDLLNSVPLRIQPRSVEILPPV